MLFFLSIREEYLAKIERRIKEYKINVLNEPREGKKLLVLDIDYTLFGMSIYIQRCSFLISMLFSPKLTHLLVLDLEL